MIRIFSLATIGLLCAACASSVESTPQQVSNSTSGEVRKGLGPQTLAPGECGLFLWTSGEQRKFVFFSKAGTETALVDLGGEAVRMSQTGADGEIFGQFMTNMQYKRPDESDRLAVYVEPGDVLEKGQRTETARLTFIDEEGWEVIVPVAGVRACQDEE